MGNVKTLAEEAVGVDAFRIVVKQEDHAIVNVNFYEPFDELGQVAGAGERVAILNVDEAEKILDVWPQHRKCSLQDVRIRVPSVAIR